MTSHIRYPWCSKLFLSSVMAWDTQTAYHPELDLLMTSASRGSNINTLTCDVELVGGGICLSMCIPCWDDVDCTRMKFQPLHVAQISRIFE